MAFDWKYQRTLQTTLSNESKRNKHKSSIGEYTNLAKEAYSKKPLSDLGNWHLITSDNNNKVYQNRISGEIVNAISGSKSLKDFANDGLQILGLGNNSLQKKRYAESELMMDRLNAVQRAPIISTASHSLGSNVANRLMNSGKVSGMNFNHNGFYARPSDNIDNSRVINIRNRNDAASILSRNNANTITLDGPKSIISSHLLDNVERLETTI